jgi:hypothetical protein
MNAGNITAERARRERVAHAFATRSMSANMQADLAAERNDSSRSKI